MAAPIGRQVPGTSSSTRIGVRVTTEGVPAAGFLPDLVPPGNLDPTGFQWIDTATPFSRCITCRCARPPARTRSAPSWRTGARRASGTEGYVRVDW